PGSRARYSLSPNGQQCNPASPSASHPSAHWLPELFDQVEPKCLPLEPIVGRDFVEGMEVHRRHPRQVGQAELAAHRMDLVVDIAVTRVTTRIVADLPTAIARRADFE